MIDWIASIWASASVWEGLEYISEGIVVIGVVGEIATENAWILSGVSRRRLRKTVEKWFGVVLILGLISSLGALVRTNKLFTGTIERAEADAKSANDRASVEDQKLVAEDKRLEIVTKEAGAAIERASQADERSKRLDASNKQLDQSLTAAKLDFTKGQTELAKAQEAEAKAQEELFMRSRPRVVTMDRKKFTDELRAVPIPPDTVEILYKPEDEEAYILASVIMQLLGPANKGGLGWNVSGPRPVTVEDAIPINNGDIPPKDIPLINRAFGFVGVGLVAPDLFPHCNHKYRGKATGIQALEFALIDSGAGGGMMAFGEPIPPNIIRVVVGAKITMQ